MTILLRPSSSDAADPAGPPQGHPFADLTPHAVLDALDSIGLRGSGRILQLNSYENRVFLVHLEDADPVVAKFYRNARWSDAQICEEHAFALELAAAEVPAVAPLQVATVTDGASGPPDTLHHVGPWRFSVSPRCGGRAPELEDPATLEWIGRFLARLHGVGQHRLFSHRLRLDGSGSARAAMAWLLGHDRLPPEARTGWQRAAERALDLADQAFRRHGALNLLRLHGDCHIGNLLWTSAGPHFVDLDDALSGPAVQDLWMLLGGSRSEMQIQLGALLDGYETIREFDRRELALIEPLRTLRIIQHSAWIARRWDDPAFPVAFPSFESPAYWSQQTTLLHEQIEAMQDEPLVA